MPDIAQYIRRSEGGVSFTTPEPRTDLEAQFSALVDPQHPKDAMFIAAGNGGAHWTLPPGISIVGRPEGVLLTTDAAKAKRFCRAHPLTDADLAAVLGYPKTKASALRTGGFVVQARNAMGHVISEAVASFGRVQATIDALAAHGRIVVLTAPMVHLRRAAL